MEDKSYLKVVNHLQSLGIIDTAYSEELLKQDLQNDTAAICMTNTRHEGKRVDYIFSILKNGEDSRYNVVGCMARMLVVPEIIHGVFNGVDTRKLESSIANVNWKMSALPLSMESNIFHDLIYLYRSGDTAAQDIAEKLMVKYWADTPLDRIFILSPDIGKYEKKLSFPIKMDMNDLIDDQIYNLLSGRSVIKFDTGENLQTRSYWIKEEKGELILFSDFDLAAKLKELPFFEPLKEVKGFEMFFELLEGKRISTNLKIDGNSVPTFIEADPANAGIAVYDMDMKPIDVSILNKRSEAKQKSKVIRPVPRRSRKGKGL